MIYSDLVFSQMASDTDSRSPRGELKRVACSGFITWMSGVTASRGCKVVGSVPITSDLPLFKVRPSCLTIPSTV